MTTPADLRDFARTMPAQSVWTPDIQGQLMDLIRPVAMATRGKLIPANDRTKALDNLYRCKPEGWCRVDEENPGPECVTRFVLWFQAPGDAALNVKAIVEPDLPCHTLALAMVDATALVWAWLAENPDKDPFHRSA